MGQPVKSGLGRESQFGIKKGAGERKFHPEPTEKKKKKKAEECPVGNSLQAKLCDAARKYHRSSEKSNKATRFEARSQNRH